MSLLKTSFKIDRHNSIARTHDDSSKAIKQISKEYSISLRQDKENSK